MERHDEPPLRNALAKPQSSEWEVWFAWYPVELLTLEIAWLRKVRRRPSGGWGHLSSSARIWDYANL